MFNPGLCPKCEDLILISRKDIFVTCPKCSDYISGEESKTKLKDWIGDPKNTTEVIGLAIELEDNYGPEISTAILALAEESFPLNEQVAYLNLKFQDFEPGHIKNHLSRFANIKAKKYQPWAEEFLQKAMIVRNMDNSALFGAYIENKVISKRKQKYIEMLREMKQSWTKTSTSSPALATLYTYYVLCAAINIAMMVCFIIFRLPIFVYPLVAVGVLMIELFILFAHNRIFGNRLVTSDTEKVFMLLYMSSIAIVIGGVFLGIFITL